MMIIMILWYYDDDVDNDNDDDDDDMRSCAVNGFVTRRIWDMENHKQKNQSNAF